MCSRLLRPYHVAIPRRVAACATLPYHGVLRRVPRCHTTACCGVCRVAIPRRVIARAASHRGRGVAMARERVGHSGRNGTPLKRAGTAYKATPLCASKKPAPRLVHHRSSSTASKTLSPQPSAFSLQPSCFGTAGSARSSSCRGGVPARRHFAARGRCAARGLCQAPRPTGRMSRRSRSRPE